MVKHIFIVALLLTLDTSVVHADQTVYPIETCIEKLPYGLPTAHTKDDITEVCRKAYITAHDNAAKIPLWVAYTLTPDHAVGCDPRNGNFSADQSLDPNHRAKASDYAHTGYDIGHMANAADMSWDPVVQNESFILSNTSPQMPNLNRGVWKLLETKIRAWANSGRTLSIYIGGIWNSNSITIGDHVIVPDYFYKIVVDNTSKETLAFIFPNEPGIETDVDTFAVSVAEVEQKSGVTFNTPGDKTVVNSLWPADLKKLLTDKRNECTLQK